MEKKELLLVVMMAVLLFTTAIQSVQLVTLNKNPVVVTSGSSQAPVASGAPSSGISTPTSLQNLPSMVGGC